MNTKDLVTARLAAVGMTLSDQELDHLAAAYSKLQQWEAVVQKMIQPETEPAVIFHAKVED